ncbi:hypothetical protein [Streptomyces sp. NRRL S-340]|uniref:hypothetical protein n=1 Tax=Streptomyces sp. NRRL S-340 TaxID=1463901 RepID=UPI00131E3C48|nr:hypothetical protein [Streptomyces sp. NRRL S-340]
MESDGLLSTVVEIVTKASDSAATGIASGTAAIVVDLVRRKLTHSQEGRTALAQVDESPQDPAAVDSLRSVLARELDGDGAFMAQLAAAVAGPPPAHRPSSIAHSVVLGSGNRLGKSQISLGPLTINNTRTARTSLLAFAVVLAALLSFVGYVLAGTFSSGDSADVSNQEICNQATPLRAQVADTDTATYAAHINEWRSVVDLTKRASDARLAKYGRFADQNYRNLGNYYIPLSNIIDYACTGEASGINDIPAAP